MWYWYLFSILNPRSAELAYKWGTIDNRDELLTEPRPLYKVKQVKHCAFFYARIFYCKKFVDLTSSDPTFFIFHLIATVTSRHLWEEKRPKYPWFHRKMDVSPSKVTWGRIYAGETKKEIDYVNINTHCYFD